jgi:hypothetical protein
MMFDDVKGAPNDNSGNRKREKSPAKENVDDFIQRPDLTFK